MVAELEVDLHGADASVLASATLPLPMVGSDPWWFSIAASIVAAPDDYLVVWSLPAITEDRALAAFFACAP